MGLVFRNVRPQKFREMVPRRGPGAGLECQVRQQPKLLARAQVHDAAGGIPQVRDPEETKMEVSLHRPLRRRCVDKIDGSVNSVSTRWAGPRCLCPERAEGGRPSLGDGGQVPSGRDLIGPEGPARLTRRKRLDAGSADSQPSGHFSHDGARARSASLDEPARQPQSGREVSTAPQRARTDRHFPNSVLSRERFVP